jgi:hypothetical protein
MARYELTLNRNAFRILGMRRARKKVTQTIRRVHNRSTVLCPVDTGYLRSTGKTDVVKVGNMAWRGSVEYTAKYATAVHDGRGPLVIRPRRPGGVLRFTIGGRVVYAKSVRQPARAGRPFLAQAFREVLGSR